MNLLTMSIADKKYNTLKAIVILNLKKIYHNWELIQLQWIP